MKSHHVLSFSLLGFLLAGCGAGTNSSDPSTTITPPQSSASSIAASSLTIPPGTECASGGIQVKTGLDTNGNGALDDSEVLNTEALCNGSEGSSGQYALITLVDESAGANCTTGGKKVLAGLDTNANTTLDDSEIQSTAYVCNGLNGTQGSDGANGHNARITVQDEPTGNNCLLGGKRIDSGIDTNDDNILSSSEITASSYICTAGSGYNQPLFTTSVEPAGSNCLYGGQKIAAGLDSNSDSTLQSTEVTSTSYSCNNGKLLLNTATVNQGVNCAYGGTKLDAGLDSNGDGTLQSTEISSTKYICNPSLDNAEWYQKDQADQSVDRGAGSPTGLHGGMAIDLAMDDNGNSVAITSGNAFVSVLVNSNAGQQTGTFMYPDTTYLYRTDFGSVIPNMLFTSVAAASSPNGKKAIVGYSKLQQALDPTYYYIKVHKLDITDTTIFAVEPAESIGQISAMYNSNDETTSDLKLAINDAGTTSAAWVEHGTFTGSSIPSIAGVGNELWVNAYRYVFSIGSSWEGPQKLLTGLKISLHSLVMNSSGDSLLVYSDQEDTRIVQHSKYWRPGLPWLDTPFPSGFDTQNNVILDTKVTTSGEVRALYYESDQLYQMTFNFSTGWSTPVAVFSTVNNIVAAKSDAQGDIIAGDSQGRLYYFNSTTLVLTERYFGPAFVLQDPNGLAIDQNGNAMFAHLNMSVLYLPRSGWTGVHLLLGTSTYEFTSGTNTTLAGSNGVFHGFHWEHDTSSSYAAKDTIFEDTLILQ